MVTPSRTSLALFLFLRLIAASAVHFSESDLVTNLPGQPKGNFKQYAGYITLDPGAKERGLFYWFFEADHRSGASLPVALWLQGGPGCASSGLGAVSEIGPFLIQEGKLVRNNHSWNKEVNLLFLDSPAGTGFSYSEDPEYIYNDYNTAVDSYNFLVGWFEKFPMYRANELYLLGESYAGHYVPQLAAQILLENRKHDRAFINLKGFNIGNPWTDAYFDNNGALKWYLYHSIISQESFDLAVQNCDLADSFYVGDVGNVTCKVAAKQINGDLQELNLENVYTSSCNIENTTGSSPNYKLRLGLQSRYRLSSTLHHGRNPCASDGVSTYLNNPEVQGALHVAGPRNWTDCSDPVANYYSHEDSVASMLPVYRELLKSDIRIWIYSGDWDGNVPTTGTQAWIKKLELPITTTWHPWDYNSQVGGWTQVYEGLTFATVRGAGHMVPADQPGKASQVLRSFLADEPLPKFHLLSS